MEKALKHSKSIVLDRCNIHPKERKQWSESAVSFGATKVGLVWINTSVTECEKRCTERKNHPTLSGSDAPEVIASFAKGFKAPKPWEYQYAARFVIGDGFELGEEGGSMAFTETDKAGLLEEVKAWNASLGKPPKPSKKKS